MLNVLKHTLDRRTQGRGTKELGGSCEDHFSLVDTLREVVGRIIFHWWSSRITVAFVRVSE